MGERTNKFLAKGLWVSIALFAFRCLIYAPKSVYDYFGAAGEAISVTIILMGLYNAILWKFNPLERIPRLMGTYNGNIEYNFSGENGTKDATVIITQTVLSVKVKIVTNEITSNTIIGNIIEENDDFVLYYTYITNPQSKYSNVNPIQYGTCRLIAKSKTELSGTYWTSQKTIGDIKLKKI